MKLKFYKLNIIEIIMLITLFIFVFNEALAKYVCPIFSYVDDFVIILIFIFYLINLIKKKGKIKFSKYEFRIFIAYIFLYIVGILGNLLSKFQENIFAILIDMLSWTKFFIAYILLVNIIKKDRVKVYYDYIAKIGKIIIAFGLILEILNLTTDLKLVDGYEKFGIKAFAFFGHPSFTSSIVAGFVAMLLVEPKKNIKWILLGLILMAATLRTKAFAYVCLIIYALIFLRKNINFLKTIMIFFIVLVVGWSQIQYYFLNPNASRARALNASIEIANDYAPVGSGFATFGTIMSGQYYSKAYYEYGLSERWGFMPDHYGYISDGGWATMIGQFGYLATIVFCIIIIFLILSLKERIKQNTSNLLPHIALIGYLLISSTNEVAFSSSYAIFYAIILAVIILKQQNKEEK